MTGYRVEALTVDRLQPAAHYLAGHSALSTDRLATELRWRLFENPARTAGIDPGQLLVTDDGAIAGVHCAIAQRFAERERTLLGVCSSAFYVDPGARLQGFLLFRRFLASNADLFFATTCNEASALLWKRVGAAPVASSRREALMPLRPDRILAALTPGTFGAMTGALASIAREPLRALRRWRGRGLQLTPSQDWNRLSLLAERHRDQGRLTAVRDEPFLRWRYGSNPSASDLRVWLARDRSGGEGWVAAVRLTRPFAPTIRSWMVTDIVWPSNDRGALLCAVGEALMSDADLLSVRGRSAELAAPAFGRLLVVTRSFPQAPVWVLRRGSGAGDGSSIDVVPADGDTAP